jgi:hypothetical protein
MQPFVTKSETEQKFDSVRYASCVLCWYAYRMNLWMDLATIQHCARLLGYLDLAAWIYLYAPKLSLVWFGWCNKQTLLFRVMDLFLSFAIGNSLSCLFSCSSPWKSTVEPESHQQQAPQIFLVFRKGKSNEIIEQEAHVLWISSIPNRVRRE